MRVEQKWMFQGSESGEGTGGYAKVGSRFRFMRKMKIIFLGNVTGIYRSRNGVVCQTSERSRYYYNHCFDSRQTGSEIDHQSS